MTAAIPIIIGAIGSGLGALVPASGLAIGGLTISAGIAQAGIGILTAGLQFGAQQLFAETPPIARDQFTITTEPELGPRFAVLGRHRVGGYRIFRDVADSTGHLWQVVMLQSRQTTSFITHYIDGQAVTLDGSGWVQTPAKWLNKIRIRTRDGTHSTHFTAVASAFPSHWTSSHVGNGMTLVAIQQQRVGRAALPTTYPNRIVAYSAVIEGVPLPSAATATATYSTNAARAVLWHLTDTDAGYGIDRNLIDLPSFKRYEDVCSEAVALNAGGTEDRYQTHGIVSYERRRVDVLRELLTNCDADLILNRDGLLEIVPMHRAATRSLSDARVVSWVMSRGIPEEQRINSVVASYVAPALRYQVTTAAPKELPLATGEARNIRQLPLPFCRSKTQAQRIAKRHLFRLNPKGTGQITCSAEAIAWQASEYASWDLDVDILRDDLRINSHEISADGATVRMQVDAYENNILLWNPAVDETDEGLASPTELTSEELSGYDLPVGRHNVSAWWPTGTGTTVRNDGDEALSFTGTATAATPATTNLHTLAKRIEALETTPSTSAVAGVYLSAAKWCLNSTAGFGGFLFSCRFGPATGVTISTHRLFVGLSASTSAPTDVAPDSLTNCLGFAWEGADTGVTFIHNDASGTATKVALDTTDFVKASLDRTEIYECTIFARPGDAASVDWEFRNLATDRVETGTVTTNLPASGTLLAPRLWMSVGTTSSVIGVALMGMSIRSEV